MSYKERLCIFWLQDCMDDFNPQLVSLYLTNISFKLLSCVCACARERKREERAEREWYIEVNILLSSPRSWKENTFVCTFIQPYPPHSLIFAVIIHQFPDHYRMFTGAMQSSKSSDTLASENCRRWVTKMVPLQVHGFKLDLKSQDLPSESFFVPLACSFSY